MSETLRPAVICEPLRTPVGRYGGVYRSLSATDLAAVVLRELVSRAGLQEGQVDDVIFGQCYPSGESPAIGRVAALDAGLGIQTPGFQIDRRCGSSLQALVIAAMQVQTGACDVVVAGGAESMSNVEHYSTQMRWGAKGDGIVLHDRLARARVTAGGRDFPVDGGMLETAENLREEYAVTREEQDALALESHRRAIAAHEEGRFADELVSVSVPQRKGDPVVVDRDEHPRPETTTESLARLKPIRGRVDPASTVTAGNASGQNDGASACIVTTPERAEELGLRPLARLAGWAVAGVEPHRMGIGPVPSTQKVLDRLGLTLADLDLIELNEAFAAQALACTKAWGLTDADFARVNVNGSGISLGHPVGATGTRIMATLLRELDRREGRYGLETMCIGGGQGMSAVFERIA
ncbi:MAG: acetyl-CoA C-acetyltransferase [Solirubrobacteraceae bacterium]|nr:acetyl-CoA C-acetyltransferase [Solirubrobacteraceae bacterium]